MYLSEMAGSWLEGTFVSQVSTDEVRGNLLGFAAGGYMSWVTPVGDDALVSAARATLLYHKHDCFARDYLPKAVKLSSIFL